MRRKSTLSPPLADRLDRLGITFEECAAICGVRVELVTAWLTDGPDTEGVVLLRWLADDADALRRVDQLRRTSTHNLRGDGATQAKVTVPYGTADIGKTTGGRPA